MSEHQPLPLFPLHTVLFPSGPLPLRIFEPRYLDMVSDCLRDDGEFGVLLIRQGGETGGAAETYSLGTSARIVDWHQRHDGLLGITVHGQRRFRLLERQVQRNQLVVGEVEYLQEPLALELTADLQPVAAMLEQIIDRVGRYYRDITPRYDDAGWVSWRLAELLPLELPEKQLLLEMNDPLMRLDRLLPLLARLHIT